jgi:hypothetical protein
MGQQVAKCSTIGAGQDSCRRCTDHGLCFSIRPSVGGYCCHELNLSFTFTLNLKFCFVLEFMLHFEFVLKLSFAKCLSRHPTKNSAKRPSDGGSYHWHRNTSHIPQHRCGHSSDISQATTKPAKKLLPFILVFKLLLVFQLVFEFSLEFALKFAFKFRFQFVLIFIFKCTGHGLLPLAT